MAICNAFGSRTEPSRRNAFGQHASRFAEVCESPLANKTTSCPSATSSSANHEITRSVPPYSLGGMDSVKGAICAICIRNPLWKSYWTLQVATAKARFPCRHRTGRHPRGHRANLPVRQRETDRGRKEKRKLSTSRSAGLPPQAGARDGRRLPSHSTRPRPPQSSAVRLPTRGRRRSIPAVEGTQQLRLCVAIQSVGARGYAAL